ncbi:hypothetical protein BC829DRAFT_488307 [Chytridium lagenaria]|nr:hypothetical protein BC829DRAFT_488307 [Chytridium lagenaria]
MSALAAKCALFDAACTQAVAAISPSSRAVIINDCEPGNFRICRSCSRSSPSTADEGCLNDPSGFLVQVPNYPMHLWEGRMPVGSVPSQRAWRNGVYSLCQEACVSSYPNDTVITSLAMSSATRPSNKFVTACTCEGGTRVPFPYQIEGLKLTPAIEGLPTNATTTQSVGVLVTTAPAAIAGATTSTSVKTSGSKKVAVKWIVATVMVAVLHCFVCCL